MDKAKRSKWVKFWVQYRLPNGKQRKELVSNSIEEARDANGKRRSQKRENRIFDMLPQANMTFQELTVWYLSLPTVSKNTSYERVQICMNNLNKVLGDFVMNTIKLTDLERYQEKRKEDGVKPQTIDMETGYAKAMVEKAFWDDKVDGRILKVFKRVERLSKLGQNTRDRILTVEEYLRLRENAKPHLKALLTVAYHTGLRREEMFKLQWSHIDREKSFIRLPAKITKERKPKSIPINHHVERGLNSLPRALQHDHVFTYGGKPITNRIRRTVMKACEKAGIVYGQNVEGGFRFHDIRATFDTNMNRAGVSESCRKRILGHSFKGMDKHYLRLGDEDLRQAMDKYTTWIDGQFANVTQTVTLEAKSVSN